MSTAKRNVTVYNRSRATILGSCVEVADSSLRRLVGLLGKSTLPPGSGLLLFPSNSIHTWGMRFSIDVVFLDCEMQVVDLCRTIPPYRLTWPRWKARSVLELPADTIENSRTEIGDELSLSTDDSLPE